MKVVSIALIFIFMSFDTHAKTERLMPTNILSVLIDDSISIESAPEHIQKAIVTYKNMGNSDTPEVINEYITSLDISHAQLNKSIHASIDLYNSKKRKYKIPPKDLFEIKSEAEKIYLWAVDNTIPEHSQILRLLYTTIKLEELGQFFMTKNRQKSTRFYMSDILNSLSIKYPCEIYKNQPNAFVDAFFTTIFDAEGSLNSNLMTKILEVPFTCPTGDFLSSSSNRRKAITLKAIATTNDYLNGIDLGKLIPQAAEQSSLKSKQVANQPNLPSYDYEAEILKLKGSTKGNDILLLMLLKHTFENGKNIDEMAKTISGLEGQLKTSYYYSGLKPEIAYDGSDTAMIGYLQHYSQNGLDGEYNFVIPCAVLIKKPNLIKPTSAYFGGNRDNLSPRSNCDVSDFPLPNSVNYYVNISKVPQAGWLDDYQGTMRFYHYKRQASANLKIRLFPLQLLNNKTINHTPYEAWSYLNLANRDTFNKLKLAFDNSKQDLKLHYIAHFYLSNSEAEQAANKALWLMSDEGHWGKPPTKGLRYQILNNVSYETIKQHIDSVEDLIDLEPSAITMKYYDGLWGEIGLPDPLLHIAVKRPKVLKLLLSKTNSLNNKKAQPLNNRYKGLAHSNQTTNVNVKNRLGKTALHTAIQFNELESAKILLKAGADSSAIVSSYNRYKKLNHDHRTIGMYAAANADIELLQYLVKQDVYLGGVDSKGIDVIGYLLGVGQLDINPHLTADNLQQYLNVLKPKIFKPTDIQLSPSYDCDKAGNYVERKICGNSYLSLLDRRLNQTYKNKYSTAVDKLAIKKQQIAWIRQRNSCSETTCIIGLYNQRLVKLTVNSM